MVLVKLRSALFSSSQLIMFRSFGKQARVDSNPNLLTIYSSSEHVDSIEKISAQKNFLSLG